MIDQAESEKTPSAFVLSQAEIENELRKHGSGFEGGKQRIMALYQTQPDRNLRAKALAKEYGIGGHSHDFLDGSRGFVNHDGRGMEFDHYPEHQKITLKQAAKTIQETDDNAHKVLNALRDEGLLELNGKTYMLSLKVYETVKTDVAYVQDKTVSQIQAKDRILEYLKHKPSITNQKAQELCGFNKNQTYYILHQMCKDGILQPDGVGRGTKYKSVKSKFTLTFTLKV